MSRAERIWPKVVGALRFTSAFPDARSSASPEYASSKRALAAYSDLGLLSVQARSILGDYSERPPPTWFNSSIHSVVDMDAARAAYDEVYVYTMARPSFILQHVVDAFAAQTASDDSKPISVVFALVGLYLHVEKHLHGRQVQQVHQLLGRQKRTWPTVHLPKDRGTMTVADVLAVPAGTDRDKAIDAWCQCVWTALSGNRQTIIDLLRQFQIG